METTEKYFRNVTEGEEFLWCGTLYKKTAVKHDDLGFDSDGNFQTLSGYLRAEIENKHDGYLERVRMVVKIYVDHGRPIWWNTFKVVPWSQICADLIKAYPDERHVWEKVEIYSVKNYRSR